MRSLLLVSLLVACATASIVSQEGVIDYRGYSVVKALIHDAATMKIVSDLDLDVWSGDGSLKYAMNDIMVNEDHIRALNFAEIPYSIMLKDVQANIDNEKTQMMASQAVAAASWYDQYHTYDEIVHRLREFAANFSSHVQLLESFGSSVQGRALPGIRVTSSSNKIKKSIYFQGGQHAREWIGPATTMYILEKLITLYNVDDEVTFFLENCEFYVAPIINPDGYNYTWTTNRLWRKNRRANVGGTFGVDLNRNWDEEWGKIGSSTNPSSDTYHGTAPFSEPESLAASKFLLFNGPHDGGIDFHSYGELVLRPYGYTTALPPNEAEAKRVGDQWVTDVHAISGKNYTSQPSWRLYYTSGTASEWFYGKQAKIDLSYTVELRDTGSFGFQLPANQIIPTGDENWNAFRGFVNNVLSQ